MANWGILGLGTIANIFASDLKFVTNANLKAVASRTLETALNFKQKYNAEIAYGSYIELAKDSDVELVYIATPHPFHYENAKLCLENGKAVLCEKPMCMNAEQVKKLCQIAKENNTLLMEALWTAFLPNFQKLQQIINSKQLGEICGFKADFGFVAPKDHTHRLINKTLGGGSVLDIGIYPIFACLELLGIPESIEAKAMLGETGVDLECNMKFNYPNNIKAELKSTLLEKTPTKIKIEFEKGNTILGPDFYRPSDLEIMSNNQIEVFKKYSEGTGYQFEAIHFQNLFNQNKLESDVITHKKSILLASYLDKTLKNIGVSY